MKSSRRTWFGPLIAGVVCLMCSKLVAAPAAGPLQVHPDNPRYFTDGTKSADGGLRVVYLTGSHTWPNLIDRGPKDPPEPFDFGAYLRLLREHDHNFIQLWGRHVTWYHGYGGDDKPILYARPLAWPRTGPGLALDGKPKFDLTKFEPAYFERLRTRVESAGRQGVYVGVMLFGGSYECRGGWRGNPFNAANNINGIEGDLNHDGEGLETQALSDPAVTAIQEAYVRKVIDTVNDLDNVLFEIANEGDASSKAWQNHLVRFVRAYEATKPKRHPVGITALMDNDNDALYASDADWVSPSTGDAAGLAKLPPADGRKVVLLDSDHWFILTILKDEKFGRDWVWKAFCDGHNPVLMEQLPPYSGSEVPVTTDDPGHAASRRAMGTTRRLAGRIGLRSMTPRRELASTGHCLAAPGAAYVVYQPQAGAEFNVDLEAGRYRVEWLEARDGAAAVGGESEIKSDGGPRQFRPPVDAPAVLYLEAQR